MDDKIIKVVVFGASSFIGREVCYQLCQQKGITVVAIQRKRKVFLFSENDQNSKDKKNLTVIDFNSPKIGKVLVDSDVVINLCGSNIMDKSWTKSHKKELWDSRVGVTKKIKDDLIQALTTKKIKSLKKNREILFINASAVGYYNEERNNEFFDENDIKTEASKKGSGFLSDLTDAWEKASCFTDQEKKTMIQAGIKIRSIQFRFGLVLGKDGGALLPIMRATNFFLGAVVGSGEQFVSWIAVNEIPEIILFVINHPKITGPINLVAPQVVSYRDFIREIARHLRRPVWLRIPVFIIKKVLKERSGLLLRGDQVYSEKLINSGYEFKYPNLRIALENL